MQHSNFVREPGAVPDTGEALEAGLAEDLVQGLLPRGEAHEEHLLGDRGRGAHAHLVARPPQDVRIHDELLEPAAVPVHLLDVHQRLDDAVPERILSAESTLTGGGCPDGPSKQAVGLKIVKMLAKSCQNFINFQKCLQISKDFDEF